ncbi:hypothetical protein CTAYLR_004735 [Chrysophaeum taylorii]|uniref:RING-type E3 ubiquitin transferase n=1 Tax=Chrysophaeum taylorii TaxID=2483200 RepID=A0AAD7U980_9STRA|nr:hypothetical protein CTAYLR_004735 [Chrysophaeum taylorii]
MDDVDDDDREVATAEMAADNEPECRICRGVAESSRTLYIPCRCRGSIMYCHEECLVQWLEHSGNDRCELCGYTFEFAPIYAEDAPRRVSVFVLAVAGARFVVARALPFVARVVLSVLLWLVATPLATCVLYRAWVHRPSELPVAWTARRLAEELGSGLAIVVAIVVSFLSLLSFTDYMRVRWEIMEMENDENNHPRPNNRRARRRARPDPVRDVAPDVEAEEAAAALANDDDDDDDDGGDEEGHNDNNNQNNNDQNNNVGGALGNQDDDDEIELHIAMDELLGLRGPLVNVARNVSWLVVFNAAYLGVFAFVPFAVGSVVSNLAARVDAARANGTTRRAAARVAAAFGAAWAERRAAGASFGAALAAATWAAAWVVIPNAAPPPPAPRSSSLAAVGRWLAAGGRLVVAAAARSVAWIYRRRPVAAAASAVNATTRRLAADATNGDATAWARLSRSIAPLEAAALDSLRALARGAAGVAGRLDGLGRALMDLVLGAAWRASPKSDDAEGPAPTLRLDDLLKMGAGYVALGVVACVWRAALKAAPRWLRRRAPARAWRRAEKALDAAAAAAKVATLLALKMVLLPSILGAGLDAALSSRALLAIRATEFPPLFFPGSSPSSVRTFKIHVPVSTYLSLDLGRLVDDEALASNATTLFPVVAASAPPPRVVVVSNASSADFPPDILDDDDRDDDDDECDAGELNNNNNNNNNDKAVVAAAAENKNATSGSRRENDEVVGEVGVAEAVRELGGGGLGVALCRWVLGISFMLVVTVAVLQLREVLHPAVLARHVRPHQHRPDLLATLLAEPARAHARRLATSLAIYGALLGVAVALPALAYSSVVPRFAPRAARLVVRFCYVAPRAQIPLELVLVHLGVLGLLERLKTRLRDAQTLWLGSACAALDLDGYLLPRPGDAAHHHHHRQVGESAPRWAWGDEPPGPRERSLAPRVAPRRFFAARVVLLLAFSWAFMVGATALVAVGPVALGRCVLDLLRAPRSHDPFALAVGWALVLFVLGPWLDDSDPLDAVRDERDEPRDLDRPRRQQEDRRRRRDRRWAEVLAFVLLWFAVAPLLVGCLYDVAVVASRDDWAAWSPPFSGKTRRVPPFDWLRDWALGLLVLQALALAAARVAADDPEDDALEDERRDPAFRRDDAGSWPRAALRFRDAIAKPVDDFDAALLYDLAVPVVLDLLDLTLAPALPTAVAVSIGRWLEENPAADLGAQILVLYRYALAATLLSSAALHLVEPLLNWFDFVHEAVRDARYLVGLRLQNHHERVRQD